MGRTVSAVAVFLAGFFGAIPLVSANGALDGKTFSGVIGPKEKTDGRPDDFVFQDGSFESTLCNTFGYGKGTYQTTAKGDAVEFTAETTSTNGGKMAWKGTVTGNQIEGATVATENGQTSESWFKGTLKTN